MMKLGIAINLPHNSPEQWAAAHRELGLSSVVFPCDYTSDVSVIDSYTSACNQFDLTIAEVGAWRNLLAIDGVEKKLNFDYCRHQLELAEYVGAKCYVNISGAKGSVWDGGYAENYLSETYAEVIDIIQRLIDSVEPKRTFYTLEPMPWMHPDSPEDYLQLIRDVHRDAFAVHMDMVNMLSSPKKYLFNKQFTNEAFELLGPYIKSCHIKDVRLENRLTLSLNECPCGQGGFDLRNYIDQIQGLSSDMPVIIEHLDDTAEYIKAIKYIKTLEMEMYE